MMNKLDKGKINSIVSDINELKGDYNGNSEDFLSCLSSILCEIDTDIAIQIMDSINTKESEYQSMAIKVNYGY